MSGPSRADILRALRDARLFDIPLESLTGVVTATPGLLRHPHRVAEAERHVRRFLAEETPIPPPIRSSVLPVLGNIAEAYVESMLADLGWHPVFDDDTAFSSGHGIDLLMLDPSLSAVAAIEVKSTIQRGRWPRLNPPSRAQMTPDWLDSTRNAGMREWDVSSADVHPMIVQVHLGRLLWRACVSSGSHVPKPIIRIDQLENLHWLTDDKQATDIRQLRE
tara:strand:+ start:10799 stop:11458 length:660 start_codon:yes stop_codon:yes gene_type:complete